MPTLRGKAGILALVLVAMAPALARADYIQAQPIYARNNTDRPIDVAAYYIPAGGHQFVSGGLVESLPRPVPTGSVEQRCQHLLLRQGRPGLGLGRQRCHRQRPGPNPPHVPPGHGALL